MTGPHRRNTSDHLLADASSGDVALVAGDARYTYGEVRSAARVLAAELNAHRLRPGSRVAIIGQNSLFWIAAYLAVMKLGHVAVPLSENLTPDNLRRNLDLVGCAAVFVDRRASRTAAAALDGSGRTILGEEVLRSGRVPYWPEHGLADPDADAALMFTSGTTAQPKAVRLTHANIQANTESILTYLGLRRDDRVLVVLPFHYCYGASLLHTHLRIGARIVLCNSFVFPESVLDVLEREECTVFAGVPSSFQLLLRASTFAQRALPSLRLIQQAGGKLPPVLVDELRAAHPAAELFVMYGQTEATARLSYLPPDQVQAKSGSIGKGIPGVELRVLGEDGEPVSPGERGEIYARGPNISPGYFEDPEGSAAKFTSLGLRTGDLAVVDDDGYMYIVDRRDDFIKSWGHRVSSQEVEAVALRMKQIVSAAVIGVPDDAAGEAVTLLVVAQPGAAVRPEEVQVTCRRLLPKHMVPRSVLVVDALPHNANGKIDKSLLRDLAPVMRGPVLRSAAYEDLRKEVADHAQPAPVAP